MKKVILYAGMFLSMGVVKSQTDHPVELIGWLKRDSADPAGRVK